MAFAKPRYPKAKVDIAGQKLADGNADQEALDIINNWRSSHRFPLQVINMMLRRRARRTDSRALVSQRLKRLPSIRNKLLRGQSETMRLSQMQDIGGCRAVVSSMGAVDRLAKLFRQGVAKNPTGRHQLVGTAKDYVTNPKEDGYRGIHYVFRYLTSSPKHAEYNGHRVEIQLRSQLQHAWATAVETVDTLTGQQLKFALGSNLGDPKWRRFFALMGSAIALREKRPLVPATPQAEGELIGELRQLSQEIQAETVLNGIGEAMRVLEDFGRADAVEHLLILNSQDKTVSIKSFSRAQLPRMEEEYLRLEVEANTHVQVVQVSVENVHALRAAYPNYYLDTQAFVQALREAVTPKRRDKDKAAKRRAA